MRIGLSDVSARHPAARKGTTSALLGFDLQIAAGEQIAVIGPSGAGKTTLLHVMACALRPASGRVDLDGRDPWQLPRRDLHRLRGELFLAPQVPPLPPRQRVVTSVLAGRLPHIGLAHSLRSLFYPSGIALADVALARFDLGDKLFERVDRLSGGERQRVGLARALVAQARLLLVDEPLSALDPARARQAMASLTQAAQDSGATLVTTMHDVPMALRHFPRILGLQNGALVFDLPAAAVTPERLHDLYIQRLDELHASSAETRSGAGQEAPLVAPAPAAMHCR